jgi:FKBP12-rapamycin complex-associated protein
LARLGARHPQALVYPLSLQLKSPRDERRLAAEGIMQGPRTVAPRLVDQALLVSEELIRVAILWHEKWHEGLEEASRLYFGDGDVDAMLQILRPLHAELSAGPTTLREAAFQQAFGRDLGEAAACLDDYERHARAEDRLGRGGDRGDGDARRRLREDADAALNQAWDLYYAGREKSATFPTSKAPLSAVFHSFWPIFGRAIISRSGLEAWMLFPERARAEHSR